MLFWYNLHFENCCYGCPVPINREEIGSLWVVSINNFHSNRARLFLDCSLVMILTPLMFLLNFFYRYYLLYMILFLLLTLDIKSPDPVAAWNLPFRFHIKRHRSNAAVRLSDYYLMNSS